MILTCRQELPWNEPELTQDLELDTLFQCHGTRPTTSFRMLLKSYLCGLRDSQDSILYRQSILKDCLKNPVIVRTFTKLRKTQWKPKQKNHWGWLLENRQSGICDVRFCWAAANVRGQPWNNCEPRPTSNADKFESDGFKTLSQWSKRSLTPLTLPSSRIIWGDWSFHHGILIGAELGRGNEGTNYILPQATG